MKKLLFTLLLLGTLSVLADRRGQLMQQRGASGFTDPSGSNTLYAWWVASDLAVNNRVNDTNPWIDRVQGILLRNGNTGEDPTNSASGIAFFPGVGTAYLTNAPLAPGSATTICLIVNPAIVASGDNALYAQGGTPFNNIYVRNSRFEYPFNTAISGTIVVGTNYDLVGSQGGGVLTFYTNGVQSATGSTAFGGWRFLGWDGTGDQPYSGYVREVLVWSNAFSSVQLSNVHYYATNTYGYAP